MTEQKLKVNMLSSSEKVPGQGVSGAYRELVSLLKREAQDQLEVTENLPIKADITHYHTIDLNYYLASFRRKRSGRNIGYVHFLPDTLDGSLKIPKLFHGIVSRYVTSFYNRMDHLVVVNPSFIQDLVDFGIPREKITYIPNFVNKEKWYPLSEAERTSYRQEQGWDDRFVVLGAGQVQKRKGIDDFLALAKEHPDHLFVWAGGFSFGGITDGYEAYKKIMANPPHNVRFPGIVSPKEMRQLYGSADLFILPSYKELFPMTILEAASCGVPIMLRDLELYHDILEGMYYPAKDVEEMSQGLVQLTSDHSALADLQASAKVISQTYSQERLLETWLSFYKEQAQAGRQKK